MESITYLTAASPHIVYSQTDFKFSRGYSHYLKTTAIFTWFIRHIVNEERQRINTKVQQENDTRAVSRIGEKENSSPATLCADSTAIADNYEKIA